MTYNDPSKLIRALYHGQFWVDRMLTSKEWLLSLDVLERLISCEPGEENEAKLIRSIKLPGKVLYHVLLDWMFQFRSDRLFFTKHKAPVEVLLPSKRAKSADTSLVKDVEARKQENFPQLSFVWNRKEYTKSLSTVYENTTAEVPDGILGSMTRLTTRGQTSFDLDPNQKATKNDNAVVRYGLWDEYLVKGLTHSVDEDAVLKSIDVLRKFMIRRWRVLVLKSVLAWKSERLVTAETYEAARDCIVRACNATWWHWDGGSRPFFWRWPKDGQLDAERGATPMFASIPTPWNRPQGKIDCLIRTRLIREKLSVIRDKGYTEVGRIRSLMPYFDVPKGTNDIRMVYDGSANGLNGTMWAPWFSLPTVNSLVHALEPGYWMADNDVGEMFHNFMLHKDVREHCGLDLTLYFPSEVTRSKRYLKERWTWLAMGLRSSPYFAVQAMMLAQEKILGDRDNPSNIFRWDKIRLILPGSEGYDSSKAWVTKIRKSGQVSADLFIYVDDIRTSAPTELEAWAASQRVSSMLGFLGIQDAARKRRSPSTEAGAWTGSVVWTSGQHVWIMTSQEKWDKTRNHLKWINCHMNAEAGMIIRS
jgi:hypothetical protein